MLRWNSQQGGGEIGPFYIPVGTPTCDSYAAGGLPLSILDYQTATSGLVVAASSEVVEIAVTVDLEHSYIGDLSLELEAPSGRVAVLHNRTGGSRNGIAGVYGDDLFPVESLGRFTGERSEGEWLPVLRVHPRRSPGRSPGLRPSGQPLDVPPARLGMPLRLVVRRSAHGTISG